MPRSKRHNHAKPPAPKATMKAPARRAGEVIQWDGKPITRPGIYKGIPLDLYHSAELFNGVFAISSSGLQKVGAVFDTVHEVASQTVPSDVAIAAVNSFNVVKAAGVNFANYCVGQRKKTGAWPAVCSVETRRIITRAIDNGTAARESVEVSVRTGQSVRATVYNALVNAITGIQSTPATQFSVGG